MAAISATSSVLCTIRCTVESVTTSQHPPPLPLLRKQQTFCASYIINACCLLFFLLDCGSAVYEDVDQAVSALWSLSLQGYGEQCGQLCSNNVVFITRELDNIAVVRATHRETVQHTRANMLFQHDSISATE